MEGDRPAGRIEAEREGWRKGGWSSSESEDEMPSAEVKSRASRIDERGMKRSGRES
jgi:hypothetical protein